MNQYVKQVISNVKKKYSYEPEFCQSVEEIFSFISPIVDIHPEYEKNDLLNRIVEPERMFIFRVTWMDDKGKYHTNTGYRCQFNGSLGPYKGGLRFQPNVYSGIIKFLGFEQTFKNSLTGLPIGGGKGGSDFDPKGKSDTEIMRFCQSYMQELYKYIGPDIDIPAGDVGVGVKEIGYLFGAYRKFKGVWQNGAFTGKDMSYGGSPIRPEATGYGAMYYLQEVLKHDGIDIKGKTIVISGYGNVAWGVCKKARQLGAKVITISGSDGFVYDKNGITSSMEKVNYLLKMRMSKKHSVKDYAEKFNVPFYPNKKPWNVKADIVMPCAVQNDVDLEDAKKIVNNGTKYYIEVANMPTTSSALKYLIKNRLTVAPSKAVNAGGVAVSALEMSQNSERLTWTEKEVDKKLHQIMVNIYKTSVNVAKKYGFGYDLIAGANLAAFQKIADAMLAQGVF